MVIQKASINGINRRRNRVGGHILTDVGESIENHDTVDLMFQVKSLETFLLQKEKVNGISTDDFSFGDACIFTSQSKEGQALIQRHLNLTGGKDKIDINDPILIHFHDIPIFIVRTIPVTFDDEEDNPSGTKNIIYMSSVHCHNNKICEDALYKVTCCSRPGVLESKTTKVEETSINYPTLSAIGIEVFLRYSKGKQSVIGFSKNQSIDSHNSTKMMTLHAKEIQKQLLKSICNSVVSVNELKVVTVNNNIELVCRVAKVLLHTNQTNNEDTTTTNASEAAMDEPYRGRIHMIHTDFYISSSTLEIVGGRKIPDGDLPADVIHVTTSDMEWFPVRRILLAPCIKMTKYVQAGRGKYKEIPTLSISERSPDAPVDDDGRPQCKVPIDCCTFDRVLLFIMSLLYPSEYRFQLEMAEINALAHAADILGLQPLSDLCYDQVSSFESRVRRDKYIRLEEVKQRNQHNDEILILLDGMVLDITRWIDEHPGGPSIIPAQALNIDCTCFFEMYHVSRQSFLYLKSFYIGELSPEDAEKLESSVEGICASDGFLQSLRSYTNEWRVTIEEKVDLNIHKSL